MDASAGARPGLFGRANNAHQALRADESEEGYRAHERRAAGLFVVVVVVVAVAMARGSIIAYVYAVSLRSRERDRVPRLMVARALL